VAEAWRDEVDETLGTTIRSITPCPGGNINEAYRIDTADGERSFVKHQPRAAPGLFAAEAAGLATLREAAGEALRVPAVRAVGPTWLVLEWLDLAAASGDFEEALGRGLARLHLASRRGRSGFDRPTFLGRWEQHNDWVDDPLAFWRDRRLGPMLDGLGRYPEVQRRGRALAERLDRVLGEAPGEVCLLHGDLWRGNAAADTSGRVCIYDPACFYGCREIEFGMTRLFGFGECFESAYREVWPLAEGWERRVELYRLHHLLSHLWHFGGGYEKSCLDLLGRLV
jgi:fructosamine-3-kinase